MSRGEKDDQIISYDCLSWIDLAECRSHLLVLFAGQFKGIFSRIKPSANEGGFIITYNHSLSILNLKFSFSRSISHEIVRGYMKGINKRFNEGNLLNGILLEELFPLNSLHLISFKLSEKQPERAYLTYQLKLSTGHNKNKASLTNGYLRFGLNALGHIFEVHYNLPLIRGKRYIQKLAVEDVSLNKNEPYSYYYRADFDSVLPMYNINVDENIVIFSASEITDFPFKEFLDQSDEFENLGLQPIGPLISDNFKEIELLTKKYMNEITDGDVSIELNDEDQQLCIYQMVKDRSVSETLSKAEAISSCLVWLSGFNSLVFNLLKDVGREPIDFFSLSSLKLVNTQNLETAILKRNLGWSLSFKYELEKNGKKKVLLNGLLRMEVSNSGRVTSVRTSLPYLSADRYNTFNPVMLEV